MTNNINQDLENLKKEVWNLSKNTLANIESALENFDADGLISLQSQIQNLNNLPNTVNTLSASVSANSTAISDLNTNKVDKISGKGLSTNDFSTTEKNKLSGIEENANNYTLPNNIATIEDIPTSLSALTDDSSHRVVTDVEKETWNGKVNIADLASVALSGSYTDLTNKPFIGFSYSNGILTISM